MAERSMQLKQNPEKKDQPDHALRADLVEIEIAPGNSHHKTH
jgi:hypothetical protein